MNKINDNIRKAKRTPRLLNNTSTLKKINTLVLNRIGTYDLQNTCYEIGPPGFGKTHRKQGHLHVLLQIGSCVTYIGDAVRISNDESVLHKV